MTRAISPPPPTPTEPVNDILHGVAVTDLYRWLEDQNAPRTRKWLQEEAAYMHAYLHGIPMRATIRQRISEMLSTSQLAEPWNVGDRYFYLRRHSEREQAVILMRSGLFGVERIIVDPASRGAGSLTAVAIVAVSEDGRFLAYSVRQGGTDHSATEILDVERNTVLPDRLPEGFCFGFTFAPDGSGFYYSHRQVHDRRPNYQAAFRHRFGTPQSQDQEVFFAGEEPNTVLGILHSPEEKLLAYPLFFTGKNRRTSIYLQDHNSGPELGMPRPLLREIAGCFIPFFLAGRLLAYTDFSAPNFRIVQIDIDDPDPEHWLDVVSESDLRIQQYAVAGQRIFVSRVNRFSTTIEAFGLDGGQKENIPFSPHGTVNLLNRAVPTEKLFYTYTSIKDPPAVYCYDTEDDRILRLDETKAPFDPATICVEETAYPSKDGTLIPLLLAARKDLLHSGPLPTFLTGYGGFRSCVTPRFTVFATFLIEQGFLFAVPALRGGSELGEQWHLAGKREKRQNSFDDFIAASEWLVKTGLSALGRIAIGGGSNAGLLVGAAITQRPDLFRAAICLGPLLDMVRYHLFDFAAGWADEYGSPDDEQDFHSLLAYSPYHRIRDDVDYPAVLVISGDADTRCNPMHARKMVARLRTASSSGHPILLDYKPSWGHMPVQPLSLKIDALTDRLAFLCHELGIQVQPRRPS